MIWTSVRAGRMVGGAVLAAVMLGGPDGRSAWAGTPAAGAGPTISALTDQTLVGTMAAMGPLLFTVVDAGTPADDLIVTASSSNQALVPDNNLVLGGTGGTRSILAVPLLDQSGQTTITVSVSDGAETTTASLLLNVLPRNTYVLAEGATGTFFHTDILLAAIFGNEGAMPVTITFLKEDGTTVPHQIAMIEGERRTIHVADIPGLESANFSAVVEIAGGVLAVERTMRCRFGVRRPHGKGVGGPDAAVAVRRLAGVLQDVLSARQSADDGEHGAHRVSAGRPAAGHARLSAAAEFAPDDRRG